MPNRRNPRISPRQRLLMQQDTEPRTTAKQSVSWESRPDIYHDGHYWHIHDANDTGLVLVRSDSTGQLFVEISFDQLSN